MFCQKWHYLFKTKPHEITKNPSSDGINNFMLSVDEIAINPPVNNSNWWVFCILLKMKYLVLHFPSVETTKSHPIAGWLFLLYS